MPARPRRTWLIEQALQIKGTQESSYGVAHASVHDTAEIMPEEGSRFAHGEPCRAYFEMTEQHDCFLTTMLDWRTVQA